MTNSAHKNPQTLLPWRLYIITFLEVWIAFTLSTFTIMLYMTHLDSSPLTIVNAVIITLLYIFVIVFCILRMVQRLSIAALMLMVPIVPLAVLLLVISLLPIIQRLL